jgi:hypothetical protein
MRTVAVSLLLFGASADAQHSPEWVRVVPPGRGAFEEAWQSDRWPMGAQPLVDADGRLHMIGIHANWHSSDGFAWQRTGALPEAGILGRSTLLHNGRLWLVGGQLGDTFRAGVWSSPDGSAWSRHADAPWSGRRGAALVSFRGWLWLSGGRDSAAVGDIWRSRNGDVWRRVTAQGPWPAEAQPILVVHHDSLWAFGGTAWNSTTAALWVSADGERWRQVRRNAPWGPRVYPGILAFDDRLWILAGVHPDGTRHHDVWSSRDGRTWHQHTAPWSRRAGNRAVVYQGALWLFGGKGEEQDGESGYASDVWRTTGLQRSGPLRRP